jgi:hypothetical protein
LARLAQQIKNFDPVIPRVTPAFGLGKGKQAGKRLDGFEGVALGAVPAFDTLDGTFNEIFHDEFLVTMTKTL